MHPVRSYSCPNKGLVRRPTLALVMLVTARPTACYENKSVSLCLKDLGIPEVPVSLHAMRQPPHIPVVDLENV